LNSGSIGGRFARTAAGIILILFALGLLSEALLPALFLGWVGWQLVRPQLNQARLSSQHQRGRALSDPMFDDDARRSEAADRTPRRDARGIYPGAYEAAARAGLDISRARAYPLDVGVMAFEGQDAPIIHRASAVLTDADYIQPYIEMYIPVPAEGIIRFEIRDGDGELIFAHSVQTSLSTGGNLITPAARLPVHDAHAFENGWELLVTANQVPIARHTILWRDHRTNALIRQHIGDDGEISPELKTLLSDSQLTPLSLDDLTADQPPIDETTLSQRAARRGR
jgi:hypothetical protein